MVQEAAVTDPLIWLFFILMLACVAWAIGCAILAITFAFKWAAVKLGIFGKS